MEKSIFTPEYQVFSKLLKETRCAAEFTQVQLAEKLHTTQSIVSKWERGELRLDIVQLQSLCQALDTSLLEFTQEFEMRTRPKRERRRKKKS